jgi:CRP-like cAMP-binding protein
MGTIMTNSEPAPLRPFLARLLRHSALDEVEQAAIMKLPGIVAEVGTHRDIVRLGDKVKHACLVLSGIVGRFSQDRVGRRQMAAIHLRGDMADLHSVVVPQATSTLQALSAATILHVPHGEIVTLARTYPAIADAFWRDCVVDAAIMAEWLTSMSLRSANSRTAHLFLEVAWRLGIAAGERPVSYDFPITQERLGELLGLTGVHVNRTLKALRTHEVLDFHHGKVSIIDWEKAAQLADFDPAYLEAASHRLPAGRSRRG